MHIYTTIPMSASFTCARAQFGVYVSEPTSTLYTSKKKDIPSNRNYQLYRDYESSLVPQAALSHEHHNICKPEIMMKIGKRAKEGW